MEHGAGYAAGKARIIALLNLLIEHGYGFIAYCFASNAAIHCAAPITRLTPARG